MNADASISDKQIPVRLFGRIRHDLRILLFQLVLIPLVFISVAVAQANNGPAIQTYIVNSGAMSQYMADFVGNIGRYLGGKSVRVNQSYRSDAINIFIVNRDRLDPARLNDLNVPDIGDAVAIENVSVILVDSNLLKKLVSLAVMYWESRWTMHRSMATVEVYGLSNLQQFWNPSQNPALTSTEVMHWRIATRGAVGFILAHEIGHIMIGYKEPTLIRKKHIFRNNRERDIHWACPEFIDQRAAQNRDIESRADQYAIDLLRSRSGDGSLGRYEVGAEWYFSVLLEQSYLEGIALVRDFDQKPQLRQFMVQRYAPIQFSDLYSRLRAKANRRRGAVSAFYPRTHPDVITRLFQSQNMDPQMVGLARSWGARMRKECASLNPQ